MRRVLLATCVTAGGLLLFAAPAAAQTLPDITVDERVPATGRAAPGSVHLVGTDSVDPALIGGTCDVNVNLSNNQSTHPNSNLLITSGSNTVIAPDVERDADTIIDTMPGTLVLEGDTITVSVQLGEDGLFSGGFTIHFACTAPTTTTTVSPTTSPPQTAAAGESSISVLGGAAERGPDSGSGSAGAGTLPRTGVSGGAVLAGTASLVAGLGLLAGIRRHRPRPLD
jgi:hypothetical protein